MFADRAIATATLGYRDHGKRRPVGLPLSMPLRLPACLPVRGESPVPDLCAGRLSLGLYSGATQLTTGEARHQTGVAKERLFSAAAALGSFYSYRRIDFLFRVGVLWAFSCGPARLLAGLQGPWISGDLIRFSFRCIAWKVNEKASGGSLELIPWGEIIEGSGRSA